MSSPDMSSGDEAAVAHQPWKSDEEIAVHTHTTSQPSPENTQVFSKDIALYRQGRGLVETKKQLDDSLTKWGTAAHCSKLIKHTTQLVATWWQAAQAADAQQDAPHAPEDPIEIHSDCISDDDELSSHSDLD